MCRKHELPVPDPETFRRVPTLHCPRQFLHALLRFETCLEITVHAQCTLQCTLQCTAQCTGPDPAHLPAIRTIEVCDCEEK